MIDLLTMLERAVHPYRDTGRDYTFTVRASDVCDLLDTITTLTIAAGCDVPSGPDTPVTVERIVAAEAHGL